MEVFDENGYTLIHSACYYNSFKICEFLVKFFKDRLTTFYKQKIRDEEGPVENFKQRVLDQVA